MDETAQSDRMRPVEAGDLGMLLEWRNHEEVRRYMYTRHLISPEEHHAWFERESGDPRSHLLVFEGAGKPAGFVRLHAIGKGGVAEWGFYAAPMAPHGTGRRLGRTALSYAFDALGLHKVCGRALASNQASIRFHDRLGFLREGVLRQQYFDGSSYHDVIAFGLLFVEWQSVSGG